MLIISFSEKLSKSKNCKTYSKRCLGIVEEKGRK